MSEIKKFIEYFNSFYGPYGLYPTSIPYSDRDLLWGILLIKSCPGMNFDGDTVDRERIMQYLEEI